jgi:uncharacterized damage-inducible protein DinB
MIQDPLVRVLFEHDFWSTRQLLAACRALTPEQFERALPIGAGSLQRTLTHLVSTMYFYADRLARQPARPRLERDGEAYSAAALYERFERTAAELAQAMAIALERHALTDMLQWTDTDADPAAPDDSASYAVVVAQIVDHGIHHRTQAMDMLTLLGVQVPMDWHPFEWDEAVRLRK